MEQIPATYSRKRSKRRLIGRYRTISTETEEEIESEPEEEIYNSLRLTDAAGRQGGMGGEEPIL